MFIKNPLFQEDGELLVLEGFLPFLLKNLFRDFKFACITKSVF